MWWTWTWRWSRRRCRSCGKVRRRRMREQRQMRGACVTRERGCGAMPTLRSSWCWTRKRGTQTEDHRRHRRLRQAGDRPHYGFPNLLPRHRTARLAAATAGAAGAAAPAQAHNTRSPHHRLPRQHRCHYCFARSRLLGLRNLSLDLIVGHCHRCRTGFAVDSGAAAVGGAAAATEGEAAYHTAYRFASIARRNGSL